MRSLQRLLIVFQVYYLLFYSRPVAAQTVQQLLWDVPDGKATDLSQTFTNGNTLPLSWNNWSSTSYIDTFKSHVDLWVTSYDFNLNQYAYTLKTDIDLTVPGSFGWTITIPDKYLSVSAKYVLRFKAPASNYNASSPQLSSPGFLVLKAAASSSSSSSSSSSVSTSSSTATSQSSIASSTPAATTNSTQNGPLAESQPSGGLSTGAKAGIGIGISLAALAAAAILGFVLWRRKKQRVNEQPLEYVPEKDKEIDNMRHPNSGPPSELPGSVTRNSAPSELYGS